MRTPTDHRTGYGAAARTPLDPWARHAFASNGFGGATHAGADPATPDRSALVRAAHAERTSAIAAAIGAAFHALQAYAQRAYASHLRRRRARELYDTLRGLDDRVLHDLGLDRSELTSVAAELTGEAERTRTQTVISTYGLPG